MNDTRRALRALLRALLARWPDAQGLYIPRGEAGLRRAIAALLDMGAGEGADEALRAQIAWFDAQAKGGMPHDPHQGAIQAAKHQAPAPDRGAGGAGAHGDGSRPL